MEFLVFCRDPIVSAEHGLKRGKSGIWYEKLWGESAARDLCDALGGSGWAVPLEDLRKRRRGSDFRYSAPSVEELSIREAQRIAALADFAAGRDWPPWEHPNEA